MLPNLILKNLQQQGLLVQPGQVHLLVGYSGGIDSTVLAYALSRMRETHPITLTAVYYDHGWRETPPPELPVVHQNCQYWNVPLVLIPANRAIPKTETAAREARYQAMMALGRQLQADAILTAHHADDQIETILFRILRGTGMDGLTGIHKKLVFKENQEEAAVPILRPMLDIYREGIRRYAEQQQLRYFDDPSNQHHHYQRVILRHEVLPSLQQRFPNLKTALLRLGTVAEGDVEIVSDRVDTLWTEIYKDNSLNIIFFNQLSRAYQRRIIKRFLNKNHIDIDFQRIEEVIDFVQGENRHNLSASLMSLKKEEALTSGDSSAKGKTRFLSIYKNRLTLAILQPSGLKTQETPISVVLAVPGETIVPPLDLKIETILLQEGESLEEESVIPSVLPATRETTVYVDLSRYADMPLEVRTRRAKDRIHPLGMPTSMRFKNFLINRGVPRFERERLPLIASGENILWAPGVGLSEELRVIDRPTHLLRIRSLSS